MLKEIVLLIAVSTLFIGCAKPALSVEATKVKALSKANIPSNCDVLNVVSARYNEEMGAATSCLTDIKNQAVGMGGNAVSVISSDANIYGVVTLTAEVLNCK